MVDYSSSNRTSVTASITASATPAEESIDAVATTVKEDDETDDLSASNAISSAPAGPKVWFISACNSPVGISVARQLLGRGDKVVAGVLPSEHERGDRGEEFDRFLDEYSHLLADASNTSTSSQVDVQPQLKVAGIDSKSFSSCQTTIALAIQQFGHIDVLFCCTSEALFGTLEELSQSARTQSLVMDQFHANFFGPVNVIKSVLPIFRRQRNGHILLLSGITGHLGTPGLGMYCASQWAIEGYVESLAYEIAPFNIKVSIIQSNIEVSVLTNKIISAPPMDAYLPPTNPAPIPRGAFQNLLDRLLASSGQLAVPDPGKADLEAESGAGPGNEAAVPGRAVDRGVGGGALFSKQITSTFSRQSPSFQANLIGETVHAVINIGGRANPPSRHIVGFEGITSVKEKLKTVSEELEEFVECSGAVDL